MGSPTIEFRNVGKEGTTEKFKQPNRLKKLSTQLRGIANDMAAIFNKNDKVVAERVASEAPDVLKEVVEAATIAQRKRDREEWKDAQSEVSDLLDDDLDL